jgi:hypothetical protein
MALWRGLQNWCLPLLGQKFVNIQLVFTRIGMGRYALLIFMVGGIMA